MIHCAITEKEISIIEAENYVARKQNGATITFVGRVRNHHEGNEIKGINYDCAKILAQNILREIAEEAAQNSKYEITIFVEHFVGYLDIGGISVIIAIGSPHRDEAYNASRYIIENIKTRLPVWKQEYLKNGQILWQDGQVLKP